MRIEKAFEKIVYKRDWFRDNLEEGKKWIEKKKIPSSPYLYRKLSSVAFLINLNNGYLDCFPSLKTNMKDASECVRYYPELYKLFPQFHDNPKFYDDILYTIEGDDYSLIDAVRFIPKNFKLVPESVVRTPGFMEKLCDLRLDYIIIGKGNYNAFTYLAIKYPDVGEPIIKDRIKNAKDFYSLKRFCDIVFTGVYGKFRPEFCKEVMEMINEYTKEYVQDQAKITTVTIDDVKVQISHIDNLSSDLRKLRDMIEKASKKPEKDNENNPNQAKTAKKPSAKTKKPVKIVIENDEVDVE